MVIRQASGVPKGRKNAAKYLAAFIEEMKSSGFVERALKDSGQTDVAVAPPAKSGSGYEISDSGHETGGMIFRP